MWIIYTIYSLDIFEQLKDTERKCEYDPGSRDIYHVWLIEKKLVYSFEKVFRDEEVVTGGNY
jgi:hypothetical protein